MKAVVLDTPGEQPGVRFDDRPNPTAPDGHVVVRVRAAGFSHHDALIMAGVLRRGVRLPLVLGHEIAGVVEATGGGVAASWSGRDVVVLPGALGHTEDGGFAERVVVPESSLVTVPAGLPAEHAALLASPIGVALKAVTDVGRARAGHTVVVTGVSGGLGVHAAQVAHAIGARVIGVTGSDEKIAELEEMDWLDAVVAPGEVPWAELVRALTDDAGADVVVDTVGGEMLDLAVRSLARHGRLVLLGQVSPEPGRLTSAEVVFREATIAGSLGAGRDHVERALAMVQAGRVTPLVDRVLPLAAESVLEAYRLLRERAVVGRVVLRPA